MALAPPSAPGLSIEDRIAAKRAALGMPALAPSAPPSGPSLPESGPDSLNSRSPALGPSVPAWRQRMGDVNLSTTGRQTQNQTPDTDPDVERRIAAKRALLAEPQEPDWLRKEREFFADALAEPPIEGGMMHAAFDPIQKRLDTMKVRLADARDPMSPGALERRNAEENLVKRWRSTPPGAAMSEEDLRTGAREAAARMSAEGRLPDYLANAEPELADKLLHVVQAGVLRPVTDVAGSAIAGLGVAAKYAPGNLLLSQIDLGYADRIRDAGHAVQAAGRDLFPGDPRLAGDLWWDTMPSAVGSFGAYLGIGALTGGIGTATAAGAQGVDEAYQRAKAKGLSEDEASLRALAGVIPGVIQAVPIMRALGRTGNPVGGRIREALASGTEGALEEAIANALGAFGQNLIERGYNSKQSLSEGISEQVGVGGAAGFLTNFGLSLMRVRARAGIPREAPVTRAQVNEAIESGADAEAVGVPQAVATTDFDLREAGKSRDEVFTELAAENETQLGRTLIGEREALRNLEGRGPKPGRESRFEAERDRLTARIGDIEALYRSKFNAEPPPGAVQPTTISPTIEEAPNAVQEREAETVLPGLRPQPGLDEGQVPAQEGAQGVRGGAEGETEVGPAGTIGRIPETTPGIPGTGPSIPETPGLFAGERPPLRTAEDLNAEIEALKRPVGEGGYQKPALARSGVTSGPEGAQPVDVPRGTSPEVVAAETAAFRQGFREKSPEHARLDEYLIRASAAEGTFTPEAADVVREAMSNVSPALLAKVDFGSYDLPRQAGKTLTHREGKPMEIGGRVYAAALGMRKGLQVLRERAAANDPSLTPGEQRFWASPASEPSAVFLHEFGHVGERTHLSKDEQALVEKVWNSKTQEQWAKFFSRGLSETQSGRVSKYLASNPREFFAQTFAEWVLTNRVSDARMKPLLRRVGDAMARALAKVRGRGHLSELEPLFAKITDGGPTTPDSLREALPPTPRQEASDERSVRGQAPVRRKPRAAGAKGAPEEGAQSRNRGGRQPRAQGAGAEGQAEDGGAQADNRERPGSGPAPAVRESQPNRLNRGERVRGVDGREATLELPDGRSLPVTYRVVEASDLTPSHDPRRGFAPTEGADANERRYEDPTEGAASRETVKRIASQPKSSLLLTDTPSATDGPPIVDPAGIVLGGNGRTMGMQLAYSQSRAGAYRSSLIARAGALGLDAEAIGRMREPVLVREVSADDAGAPGELSRVLNQPLTTARSEITDAVSRGSKITPEAASSIASAVGDDGLRAAMRDKPRAAALLRALRTSGAFTDAELTQYVRGGDITDQGKAAIEQALLGAAVGDVRALAEMPPSAENALMKSLGAIVRLNRPAHRGGDPSFGRSLALAIEGYADMRRSEARSVRDYISQDTLSPRPWVEDRNAMALVKAFDTMTPTQIRAKLDAMAEAVENAQSGQATFLGDTPTVEGAWREAFGSPPAPRGTAPGPDSRAPNRRRRLPAKHALEYIRRTSGDAEGLDAEAARQLIAEQRSDFEERRVRLSDIERIMGEGSIDPAKVERYARSLGKSEPPPVVLGVLRGQLTAIDGKHRIAAYRKAGLDEIQAFVPISWSIEHPDSLREYGMPSYPDEQTVQRMRQRVHRLERALESARERGAKPESIARVEERLAEERERLFEIDAGESPPQTTLGASGHQPWITALVEPQNVPEKGAPLPVRHPQIPLQSPPPIESSPPDPVQSSTPAPALYAPEPRVPLPRTKAGRLALGTSDILGASRNWLSEETLRAIPTQAGKWGREVLIPQVERVIDNTKKFLGEVRDQRVAALRSIRTHPWVSAKLQETDFGDKQWGVARIVDAVEGRIPENELGDVEREFVHKYRELIEHTGKILERERFVQWVPPIRDAEGNIEEPGHLAPFTHTKGGKVFLRSATDALRDLYMRPSGPAWDVYVKAIADMNGIDLAEAQERAMSAARNPFSRIGPEIARLFPRHPTAIIVKVGGVDRVIPLLRTDPFGAVESMARDFATRAAFVGEFGQSWRVEGEQPPPTTTKAKMPEYDPFAMNERLGDPENAALTPGEVRIRAYADKRARAARQEVAQEIRDNPTPEAPGFEIVGEGSMTNLDILRGKFEMHGGNPAAFDQLMRALSGLQTHNPLATPGTAAYEVTDLVSTLASVSRSNLLTRAAVSNLPEWMGNIRSFGGTSRAIPAMVDLIKPTRSLIEGLERAGIVAPGDIPETGREFIDLLERQGLASADMARYTVDKDRWLKGMARLFGDGVTRLFGTHAAWNWQEQHGAATGLRMAMDMKNGKGGVFDFLTLRAMNFSKADALTLMRGKGTNEQYLTFARRFATRSNSTNLTLPAEESRAVNNRHWRNWMWFTRYPTMKARTGFRAIATLAESMRDAIKEPTPENRRIAGASAVKVADWMAGTAASGALAHLLLAGIMGGRVGLGVALDDWRDDPVGMAAKSFAWAQFGPILTSIYRTATDKRIDSIWRISAGASILADAVSALAPGGLGEYYGLGLTERLAKFAKRYSPGHKAAAALAAQFGLGEKDPDLDTAIATFYRWKRESGIAGDKFEPGPTPGSVLRFRREMRKAVDLLKTRNPLSDENQEQIQKHIAEALELKGKDLVDAGETEGDAETRKESRKRIAASLRGRKLLTGLKPDQREKFVAKYGQALLDRLEAHDDLLEEWAKAVSKGRERPLSGKTQ